MGGAIGSFSSYWGPQLVMDGLLMINNGFYKWIRSNNKGPTIKVYGGFLGQFGNAQAVMVGL